MILHLRAGMPDDAEIACYDFRVPVPICIDSGRSRCPEPHIRAYLMIPRGRDGGQIRSESDSSSIIFSLQVSEEQRRFGRIWPRPARSGNRNFRIATPKKPPWAFAAMTEGLPPTRPDAALPGLTVLGYGRPGVLPAGAWVTTRLAWNHEIGSGEPGRMLKKPSTAFSAPRSECAIFGSPRCSHAHAASFRQTTAGPR